MDEKSENSEPKLSETEQKELSDYLQVLTREDKMKISLRLSMIIESLSYYVYPSLK